MPISFLDLLDTRRKFKGYKEPKSSEPSSGSQTPNRTGKAAADTSETSSQAVIDDGAEYSAQGTCSRPDGSLLHKLKFVQVRHSNPDPEERSVGRA